MKYTGLGKSGYGKILRRQSGESLQSLVRRQEEEYKKSCDETEKLQELRKRAKKIFK